VTKALLEVYELEVAEQQLAQDRVRSRAQFAAFFGDVRVPIDRLVGELDPEHDEAIATFDPDTLVAHHPALRAARINVSAAQATLREARASRIPDLNLFVGYGNFEPLDENFIDAGISFPLPLFDRNQGRIAESRALIARSEDRARIVETELTVTLAATQQRHDKLHDQLEAMMGRIAPAAERGLDQAQEAYRVGRLMFLELVDAQRTYADVRLRTLELRRDLAMVEADWMSLLGTGPYANPGEER
jgi:cobalt-zinc-cadmium efflux system outer membrane protein